MQEPQLAATSFPGAGSHGCRYFSKSQSETQSRLDGGVVSFTNTETNRLPAGRQQASAVTFTEPPLRKPGSQDNYIGILSKDVRRIYSLLVIFFLYCNFILLHPPVDREVLLPFSLLLCMLEHSHVSNVSNFF